MNQRNIERIADALDRLARSQAKIADAAETANTRRWDQGIAVYVNGSPHALRGDAALAELYMLPDGAVAADEFGNEWRADTVGWVCQCSSCLSSGRPFVYEGETGDWLREYGPMHVTVDDTVSERPGDATVVSGYPESSASPVPEPLWDGVHEDAADRVAWLDEAQERVARVLSGGLWESLDDQDRADLLATGRAAAAAALPMSVAWHREG